MRTGSTQLPSSARGWIHKTGNDGFIKLIEDARRGVLVGATSAGVIVGGSRWVGCAATAELQVGRVRTLSVPVRGVSRFASLAARTYSGQARVFT